MNLLLDKIYQRALPRQNNFFDDSSDEEEAVHTLNLLSANKKKKNQSSETTHRAGHTKLVSELLNTQRKMQIQIPLPTYSERKSRV